MKNRTKQLETKFARERRFTLKPTTAAVSRRKREQQLETLKQTLLRPFVEPAGDPALLDAMQRAATEAAGLAWLTPCPALFFPALFEEKVQTAQRYIERQRRIQRGLRSAIEQAA